MIDQSTNIRKLVHLASDWAGTTDHYYQKRPAIVGRIEYNGRIFYPRYEKVNRQFTNELAKLHLSRQINVAIPITHHGRGSYLFFVYDGDSPDRFVYLFEHLLKTKHRNKYTIVSGKRPSSRIIAIELPTQDVSLLHEYGKMLSALMEKNITKSWKILPDPSLPESYNIITLPYIN